MRRRLAVALALMAMAVASSAAAQSAPAPDKPEQASQALTTTTTETASLDTRPATTTFYGDTGLWFVPTAEILPKKQWSVSGYRAGFNDQQGFTNIASFAATFGVGLTDRVELLGSWRLDTRIDRDARPLFSDGQVGGLLNQYPYVTNGWTGDKLGDLYVGVKYNVLSEYRQNPAAFALRGIVKVPTGDRTAGVGTGKADVLVDAIVSKEMNQKVELSGFGGFIWRGKADDPVSVDTSSGFRYGVGAAFPSRGAFRAFTELHGEAPFNGTLTASAPVVGADGLMSPLVSAIRKTQTATVGVVWQARNGFFAGAGVNWNFPGQSRSGFGSEGDQTGDYVDYQVRLGFHPGTRVYVPALPPPPPPPPPPPALQPPTVRAQCQPCTVEVGKSSTVTAQGNEPNGLPLSYRWSAPAGTFANAGQSQTVWTAPDQEGPVPVTVTVDNGKGGTASDRVTIQVVRPPNKTFTFEDVHFDFDRYSLRPDATRILDEAVNTLRENAELKVTIEGHTCNIGTPEYNLALGERRANSVRDYLVSRGISADRFRTVSYGEERPKYDNSREETRRLNRRAALVVRIE